jgi:hypothetical protein
MTHWSLGASVPVMLLGLTLLVVCAGFSYANWRRAGRRRLVTFLEGLRVVLVLLLTFTLLRPEYVQQLHRTDPPEVVVLCDASGSMATRDVLSPTGAVTRAEWLAGARAARFWQPLESTAKVLVEDFAAPAARTNSPPDPHEGTDLNRALEQVLQRQRNLKALLLLSDGDWNLGKSPIGTATRYRDQGIPIFAVAVGSETPLPDLALESVNPPSYGLFGEQIVIPFKVRSQLPHEVKTTVTLQVADREEASKPLVIPPLGEVQDGLLWSPRATGEVHLTLRVPVQPDEALAENNESRFRMSIRVETLKVLVVDSLPRWEYRYLRNALARDPGVEMHCMLFHPGMSPGGGRHYLPAFPGTKEALSVYDVIFLGDVGIGENELTAQDAELIKGLVEQQGSGLVLLPGRRGRQATLLDSPLKDLVPVVLDSTKPEGTSLQNESVLLLSSAGERHWLTRLEADESRNAEIWKLLPGFFWSAAVEKARPGAEVLAVHSSLRNAWGRLPLLVTRPAGSGKVLFMGTDSAWRWRRGVEDRYHYRFWSQVVRWMAHQRHLAEKQGLRLVFSPESPQVGQTVFMQATVLDERGSPVNEGPLVGRVTSPSGRTERVEFTPVEGGWGVFKASFLPASGGTYRIALNAERHGRTLETELAVTQPVLEKQGQPMNLEILRELASLTHGAVGTTDDLHPLVEQISLLPEPKPVERRVRLWSSPWWGGLLLLLLAVYWTGRKLAGFV